MAGGVFGEPPILEPNFSGDWDVPWGHDLGFDPCDKDMVVGQNLRCLFGDGYHSTVAFPEDFLGVHRGTGVLTLIC